MNPLKKLLGQTAIYGLSSMLARFISFLLIYLHANKIELDCFTPTQSVPVFTPEQYGIISGMYAYVGFLIILLTYGMETAFFRLINKKPKKASLVYKTAITSLVGTSTFCILLAFLFAQPIADALRYPDNKEFIIWFAFIVGLDAISSIPLAKLRHQNKPGLFVAANFLNVLVNVGLNIFFLGYCKPLALCGEGNWLVRTFYNEELGVSYVFIANLVASGAKFALLIPSMIRFGSSKKEVKPQDASVIDEKIDEDELEDQDENSEISKKRFDFSIWKQMIKYGWPIMLMGIAGMINETLDRILLERILDPIMGPEKARAEVGIYSACYKIAMIMTLFIQAFRYAAEPFFFSHAKEKSSKETFAEVTKWFAVFCSLIFLFVMSFIDQFKRMIPNDEFWVGLNVVPILLIANLFFGLTYNLSVWFKLSDRTIFGAILAIFGALITILFNIILIPKISYLGSAYATLVCYVSMTLLSYFLGRKYYPIPYPVFKILFYVGLSIGIYFSLTLFPTDDLVVYLSLRIAGFALFISLLYFLDLKSYLKHFKLRS